MTDDIIRRLREAIAAGTRPGEWRVSKHRDERNALIYDADGFEVARVCYPNRDANATYIAAASPDNIVAILGHVDAQAAEIDRLTAALRAQPGPVSMADVEWAGKVHLAEAIRERDELRDVLLRAGFAPCDIPACNCGSWHHRYGLPERMQEIKDALAEAGHELSNANGNLTLNALKGLVAERDELRRQLAEARAEREAMANVLPGHCYMDPPDGGDVPVLEQLRRMAKDAERYRFLSCKGVPPYFHRCSRWRLEYWNGEWWDPLMKEELDAAIDAQIEKEERP